MEKELEKVKNKENIKKNVTNAPLRKKRVVVESKEKAETKVKKTSVKTLSNKNSSVALKKEITKESVSQKDVKRQPRKNEITSNEETIIVKSTIPRQKKNATKKEKSVKTEQNILEEQEKEITKESVSQKKVKMQPQKKKTTANEDIDIVKRTAPKQKKIPKPKEKIAKAELNISDEQEESKSENKSQAKLSSLENVNINKKEEIINNDNKVSPYNVMRFVIISTCVISLVGGYVIGGIINSSVGLGKFNRLQESYKLLKDNYLYDIDDYNIENALIDGIATGLNDNYSKYYTNSDIEDYNKDIYGKYKGIGIELMTNRSNQVIVSQVFKNSPASASGIMFQDIITHVNGTLVTNNVAASELISKSNNVSLNILRNGTSFIVDLVNSEMSSENIYVKHYDNILYMRVASFYSGAYQELEKNIKSLKEEGRNKIILDLRYAYKGTDESEVINMASLFVPNNQVLYQVKKGKNINLVKSTNKYILGLEIIILQNNTTRMFGELFTSAIRENNPNIKIIGNNTAGETSMTESYTLKDKSTLVIPTSKWLTSKGNDLTNIGVEPTEYISIGENYYNSLNDIDDNQLQTALNYLK